MIHPIFISSNSGNYIFLDFIKKGTMMHVYDKINYVFTT